MSTSHTGGDTKANKPDDVGGFVFRDATKEELGFDPDAPWLGRRNRDVLIEDIMAGRVKILHPDIAWMFNPRASITAPALRDFKALVLCDRALNVFQAWHPPKVSTQGTVAHIQMKDGFTPEQQKDATDRWCSAWQDSGADNVPSPDPDGPLLLKGLDQFGEHFEEVLRRGKFLDPDGFTRCWTLKPAEGEPKPTSHSKPAATASETKSDTVQPPSPNDPDRNVTPEIAGEISPQPTLNRQAAITSDSLRPWVTNKLKGNQRRAMELILDGGGTCRLADIACDPAIGWNVPYDDSWNSIMREINKKLKRGKKPFRLCRQDNQARLKPISDGRKK